MARVYFLFALAATILVLYFHQGRSWNVDSRLLTVYGLVEHHTLRADDWKGDTGDYATVDGHVYSDKAPLASLLVVPGYWAWRYHEHFRPMTPLDKETGNHIGVLFASAIPFGVFAALVFARVRRHATSPGAAVWIAWIAAFGTCLGNYGGCFFGHMLAATLFLAAYALAVDRERHFLVAGFLGSAAVLTEYTLLLTQVAVCVYLLFGAKRWKRLGLYVAGATPGAVGMFVYNKLITGKFLDFPYSHVTDTFAPMKTAFGIRLPDVQAAWELLFGQYRGLAFYAPTLLLFLPLVFLRFDGRHRRRNLVLGISTIYFLCISSYFKWDGGWCTGPRHLAPIITLLSYEGAASLAAIRRGRFLFVCLAAWGAAVSVCASATDSITNESVKAPAFEVYFPHAWKGEINDHTLLFEVFGVPRSFKLVVGWFALFLVLGGLLSWAYRRRLARLTRAPSAPPEPAPALAAAPL
jgi:hypothetical protein